MSSHTLITSTVLLALSILALCAAQQNYQGSDRQPTKRIRFPDTFYFGAGSGSYQIEGAWNVSGKSQSIWDVFTHKPGFIRDNSTGDDACKSYEYYKRDIQMLKYLGVNFYRFSIPWARILPTGFTDNINQEAIDHYNKLIDELLKYNIKPFVTIYHWELPQRLQDFGGWTNPAIVFWYRDYAEVLFKNYGDRVTMWASFNGPALIIRGYHSTLLAPGLESTGGIGDYMAAKNIVMANAHAYQLYAKKYKQKQHGIFGISLSANNYEGITNSTEDAQAAKDAYDFEVGLFANPIFSINGGFPPKVVEVVAAKSKEQGFTTSRLPEFTDEERKFCRGTADFFGMNHYSTFFVTRKGYKPGMYIQPSLKDDLGVVKPLNNYPVTETNIEVVPHGIRSALRRVKETYREFNPPVIISENGASQSALNDTLRINFLKKYLNNVLAAMIEDSVTVYGYSIWSLMDCFEWTDGYKTKYGIFKVDFSDPKRKREARLSAIWYRHLVKNMTLDPGYEPKYEKIEF